MRHYNMVEKRSIVPAVFNVTKSRSPVRLASLSCEIFPWSCFSIVSSCLSTIPPAHHSFTDFCPPFRDESLRTQLLNPALTVADGHMQQQEPSNLGLLASSLLQYSDIFSRSFEEEMESISNFVGLHIDYMKRRQNERAIYDFSNKLLNVRIDEAPWKWLKRLIPRL